MKKRKLSKKSSNKEVGSNYKVPLFKEKVKFSWPFAASMVIIVLAVLVFFLLSLSSPTVKKNYVEMSPEDLSRIADKIINLKQQIDILDETIVQIEESGEVELKLSLEIINLLALHNIEIDFFSFIRDDDYYKKDGPNGGTFYKSSDIYGDLYDLNTIKENLQEDYDLAVGELWDILGDLDPKERVEVLSQVFN